MFSIYSITNIITGKKYIGYTNDTKKRFANHRSCGERGVGSCTQLYKSMKKHGIDNFLFEVIRSDIGTVEEAKKLEIELISEYDTYRNGYNANAGGTGGDMSSYESWRDSMTNLHANKKLSDYATCGMQGKTHSLESKQKQSDARKKHWDSLTDEELQERSSKIKGSKNGMFGKTPKNSIQIELYGIIYDSITQACKETGHSAKFVKKHGTIL